MMCGGLLRIERVIQPSKVQPRVKPVDALLGAPTYVGIKQDQTGGNQTGIKQESMSQVHIFSSR